MRLAAVLFFVFLASGCSVKYPVVASFDDYKEVIEGVVDHNLIVGRAHIEAKGKVTGIVCNGYSEVTYVPMFSFGCSGQRGIAKLTCSDGRRINADWKAESCTFGHGTGRDQNGAMFTFVFGLKEQEAMEWIKREMVRVEDKEELPTYNPKKVRKEKGFSTGTGFYVSSEGLIATNYHVVEGAQVIVVRLKDGTEQEAKLIQRDPGNDIAILQIDKHGTPLTISNAFTAKKGDEVFTLGYPLIDIQGNEIKATFGRVNSINGLKDDVRYTQIDVPVQPGNSGGPLINKQGEVVGVVTSTLNQINTLKKSGSLPQNVNYAVKVDYLVPLVRQHLEGKQNKNNEKKAREISEIVEALEESVVLVVAK